MVHSWLDRNLQRSSAIHLVQSKLIVLELEYIRHHSLHFDLAAIEVCDCSWEAVCL
jgi:hypothetical protein